MRQGGCLGVKLGTSPDFKGWQRGQRANSQQPQSMPGRGLGDFGFIFFK